MHHCNSLCSHGNHHHPSESYVQTLHSETNTNRPDPSNYEILEIIEYEEYKVLKVKYPGVSTFNGEKCLLVKCDIVDLLKTKTLDPHFFDGERLSKIKVIARFPPTTNGIGDAKRLAHIITDCR